MPYHYDQPDNLVTLIEGSVAQFPQNPLFGTKNTDGSYEWVTYQEVGRRIDNLRAGMVQRGIGKGDAVGIIAPNCTEWAVAAFATYGLGGTSPCTSRNWPVPGSTLSTMVANSFCLFSSRI